MNTIQKKILLRYFFYHFFFLVGALEIGLMLSGESDNVHGTFEAVIQ